MARWGWVFEEPDLFLDAQLLGEPVGDQVVDDLERRGEEVGLRGRAVAAGVVEDEPDDQHPLVDRPVGERYRPSIS